MKNEIKIFAILILAAGIFTLACQSNKTINSNENATLTVEKQIYKATGIVKAIDTGAYKITIAHEDIPGYMPAMEMNEAVNDPRLLETLKPGDKIEFEIERTGAKILITEIKKTGN